MDKEQLIEMAKDPTLISGIYNYCDRWCERCPFTSRCLSYKSSCEDDDPDVNDMNNKMFWDKISDNSKLAMEMILGHAEEHGIDLNDIDPEATARSEEKLRRDAEAKPVARWSESYIKTVDDWFSPRQKTFDEKGQELVALYKMDLPDTNAEEEADSLRDCVDIIKWYQFQIHVKLMRALMQEEDLAGIDDDLPSDSDGSAKVALIGMDRSIGAWTLLMDHLPGESDSILDVLVLIARIRKQAELDFPNARSFIRPGFDTEK
jgi:hypothetical protein